jgi:hypothetical protein
MPVRLFIVQKSTNKPVFSQPKAYATFRFRFFCTIPFRLIISCIFCSMFFQNHAGESESCPSFYYASITRK